VLLQNVRVIAMDQDAQGPKEGQPVVSRTATVEVTPVDAQKLVLGQQLGTLSLTLRKPGVQQNISNVETVSLADLRYSLYGSQAPAAVGPLPAMPSGAPVPVRRIYAPRAVVRRVAPKSTTSIEVMRGTTSSKYEVGGYAK